ncbi:ESCRT-III subunit protein snf7 [Mycoemilia scoparia]|uniref:Vacuolar-sorting protein SNF7 n=1 Tax=Mycoemilia scoparia TaxID=417184 RepID=A0A9W7ZK27_9FUNG|nr:ESCRT-III subunit protein snf7 [Mycoemilia scoparia]
MRFLWGAPKPKAQPKDAITKLRSNLAMLEKREAHIQSKIDKELEIAKANATKNKVVAMQALKRKKMHEQELQKISGSRMTLETQVMAIESAAVNLETMEAMRQGAEAMKTIHKDLTTEKVDKTMEDIEEQMDLANEISEAISQPQFANGAMDEDELAAELEEMEQQALDKQLLGAGKAPISLPAAGTATTVAKGKQPAVANEDEDEDAELAQLRESMGLSA